MVPGATAPRLSWAATGSYGFIEAQEGQVCQPGQPGGAPCGDGFIDVRESQDGVNHRLGGRLALGIAPFPWLEGALRLEGRYDKHPSDPQGADDGLVGEPHLQLRMGDRAGEFLLGGDAQVWLIGAEAPSVVWDATTVDLRGLAAYSPRESDLVVAVNIGWRFDRSGESESHANRLRLGDRVALGVSDSDALLLGLGARHRFGPVEALGEITGDVLVGADAPDVWASPIRVGVGSRYWVSERVAVAFHSELGLSARPSLAAEDPQVPIEPRLEFQLGLRFRQGFKDETPRPPPSKPPPSNKEPRDDPTSPSVDTPRYEIGGVVVDEAGQPVPDAAVTLIWGDSELEYRTAADGSYRFEVEAGKGSLVVRSPGFDETQLELEVGEESEPLEVILRPAVPAGELKGLVRGLDGIPVSATITVSGTQVKLTTDATGSFSADVPPGSYVVRIEADGFVSQSRRVRIENRGVTVLNVDLRKKR